MKQKIEARLSPSDLESIRVWGESVGLKLSAAVRSVIHAGMEHHDIPVAPPEERKRPAPKPKAPKPPKAPRQAKPKSLRHAFTLPLPERED